ncbi:class I SAM-dependent methyltransferase [Propionicimonas sp.]|uniref:class I SAM-dependent methyltransferase n=1 Tax=Propionicimonas sp. TaxID=1955623 RepID=UPI003D111803
MSERTAEAWDAVAAGFDEAADHGLTDGTVRAAWAALLERVLPSAPGVIADLGCGTGSLSMLAAEQGHRVVGVDFSGAMLAVATSKAGRASTAGLAGEAGRTGGVTFVQADVSTPPLAPAGFDAVLCRHVLWALPDPRASLERWARLLRPHGRIVLIEGLWSTGAGLPSGRVAALLEGLGRAVAVEPLTDPSYWGGPISDERYVVTAISPAVPGRGPSAPGRRHGGGGC